MTEKVRKTYFVIQRFFLSFHEVLFPLFEKLAAGPFFFKPTSVTISMLCFSHTSHSGIVSLPTRSPPLANTFGLMISRALETVGSFSISNGMTKSTPRMALTTEQRTRRHDEASRAQILKRLTLFGAQESVAVDDDGECVAVLLAFQDTTNVPGVERIKPAAGGDHFPERRPQLSEFLKRYYFPAE